MLMLRYAYVLALTVWLGGMIVLGAVVAPGTFGVLPEMEPGTGRALAGAVFGTVLARFHYVAYAAGAVLLIVLLALAILGPRPRHFAVRTALVAAMLGIALYSGLVVLAEIDGIQSQLVATATGSSTLPSQLPATDARRIRFDYLHHLSTRLMLVNVAGGLLLLVWEARE
jgi:uncharacterized membrane protein